MAPSLVKKVGKVTILSIVEDFWSRVDNLNAYRYTAKGRNYYGNEVRRSLNLPLRHGKSFV